MNVDILGISELRGTGMGEFNSDEHCIYYCGQESLRRNGVAIIVNKRVIWYDTIYMQNFKKIIHMNLFTKQKQTQQS